MVREGQGQVATIMVYTFRGQAFGKGRKDNGFLLSRSLDLFAGQSISMGRK